MGWVWVLYAEWTWDRQEFGAFDVVGAWASAVALAGFGPGRGVVWQCESGSGASLGALGHLGGLLAWRCVRCGLGDAGVVRRCHG